MLGSGEEVYLEWALFFFEPGWGRAFAPSGVWRPIRCHQQLSPAAGFALVRLQPDPCCGRPERPNDAAVHDNIFGERTLFARPSSKRISPDKLSAVFLPVVPDHIQKVTGRPRNWRSPCWSVFVTDRHKVKPNTANIKNRFFSVMTLLLAACLFLGVAAKANQITWISDSTTGLNVAITGTISIGDQANLSYESPSGLWDANYGFSIGFDGYDAQGNALYVLNTTGGRETYWNGGYLFEAGWGDVAPIPLVGGENLDTNSFTDAAGSLWSANSRIKVTPDPDDSSLLDYTITLSADGPTLPAVPTSVVQTHPPAPAPDSGSAAALKPDCGIFRACPDGLGKFVPDSGFRRQRQRHESATSRRRPVPWRHLASPTSCPIPR